MKQILTILAILLSTTSVFSNDGILHNKKNKTITITAEKGLSIIEINYAKGCFIDKLLVKGDNKLSASGVFTGFTLGDKSFSSKDSRTLPNVKVDRSKVAITNIKIGDNQLTINENWYFELTRSGITWKISRQYPTDQTFEDLAFPKWNFKDMGVWKAGIIDNGGMVWCKYLGTANDTYGVHTGGTTYYNDKTGDGLSIQGKALDGKQIATKYSRSQQGEFTSTHLVTTQLLKQRHNLSRFVHARYDVFAPAYAEKGIAEASFHISYVNYHKTYDRGELKNINSPAVRELLNTTARYGVVDNNIVGGNGWITNWKCLHEPFFAQVALGLADTNYTRNLAATLDQERDLAMLPSGRVLSRWHNARGDEIPGTFNDSTGYYEAMWGYTIDSQTGYVINVSELFNLNGDIAWLKGHQQNIRKALEWLLQRDSNHNGVFEMMNNNISEEKCSDWLDIVWASFENAFVNAQLYDALIKWSACEAILGDDAASLKYKTIAARLKETFNKPVNEGGFWSAEKKQFVYWRDKDGSVHGDNLVTPVQFMVIATGLCDDPEKTKIVLQNIEERTVAENLFHWPLCFDSYKREEVSGGNWPFPKYENGDIFPTWGYVGVRSYVKYDKAIALKYIKNLLAQYEKDGLSSQRYLRTTQTGEGSDILSGICTGITALYSDIYGIQPRWNRLVLAPNLVPELYGTNFTYPLRSKDYKIELKEEWISAATDFYSAASRNSFGISGQKGKVIFYPGDQDTLSLSVTNTFDKQINLKTYVFYNREISFSISDIGKYNILISGLDPTTSCEVTINGFSKTYKPLKNGTVDIKNYEIKDSKD